MRGRVGEIRFLLYGLLLPRVAARMQGRMHEHNNEGDEAERRDGQDVVEHQSRCRIRLGILLFL